MNKFIVLVVVIALLVSANVVFADGKFYAREKIPPGIPYQRALILFDGNQETLILQSKYQLQEAEKDTFLGWVVPVPNVPDLASMPADQTSRLFTHLGFLSSPNVISVSAFIIGFGFFTLFTLTIILLLIYLFSLFLPPLRGVRTYLNKNISIRYILYPLLLLFLMAILIPNSASRGRERGVDVIKEERVGIYNIRVVKSDEPDKLIEWLNENNFQFDESDREAFDDYIKGKWCFVVAQIEASEDSGSWEVIFEGLVAPLILKFKTDKAVYPLSLTSTVGQDAQILLYVLSKNKMECGDRLKLLYAKEINPKFQADSDVLDILNKKVEPQNFFSEEETSLPFLCKFKDTLTPLQMREDLIFSDAEDNEPYREKVIRW